MYMCTNQTETFDNYVLEQAGQAIKMFSKSQSRSYNKCPTVVPSVMLIACLVVDMIQCCIVFLWQPTVTLFQGQGHQTEQGYICHV